MSVLFIIFFLLSSLVSAPDWDFDWVGEPGYEWDGVEPDYFDADRHFTYRIRVNSPSEPLWVTLNLDWNADGEFSRSEQIAMKLESSDSLGFIYSADVTFGESTSAYPLAYYFSAQVGYTVKTSQLMLGPFVGNRVSFALIGDTLWDITGPVAPLEVVLNSMRNTFLLTNTGDIPITFGLAIDANAGSFWTPVAKYDDIGENKYILSVVFTDLDVDSAKVSWFNSSDWEDVVTYVPKFAGGQRFGVGAKSAGEGVAPGDTIAMWLNLIAPSSTDGSAEDQKYSVRMKIFAVSE